MSEAGPRMQVDCCCIDCCQRVEYSEALGATFTDDRSLGGTHNGMFGNCIVKVEGKEYCKAFQLRDKSKNKFALCTECHSLVCMYAPDLGNNMFEMPLMSVNVENSKVPIARTEAMG